MYVVIANIGQLGFLIFSNIVLNMVRHTNCLQFSVEDRRSFAETAVLSDSFDSLSSYAEGQASVEAKR